MAESSLVCRLLLRIVGRLPLTDGTSHTDGRRRTNLRSYAGEWRPERVRFRFLQSTDIRRRLMTIHNFFVEPNHDAIIECLPTRHGPNDSIKYLPITAGDYMIEKFARQAKGEEWSEADRRKFDTSDTETRFTE